jgi:hypothetical protein
MYWKYVELKKRFSFKSPTNMIAEYETNVPLYIYSIRVFVGFINIENFVKKIKTQGDGSP